MNNTIDHLIESFNADELLDKSINTDYELRGIISELVMSIGLHQNKTDEIEPIIHKLLNTFDLLKELKLAHSKTILKGAFKPYNKLINDAVKKTEKSNEI